MEQPSQREQYRDVHTDQACMNWLKSRGAIESPETDMRRVLSRARSCRWNEVEGELCLIKANAKEVRVPKPEDRLDLVKVCFPVRAV
ncbi:hypothetical protein CYMTET_5788 [Cymbomonas tetramitiformis]|uniref:Uncharacterized protein n=1 Tax=Cymbomonas tetramitiformis TaxID=36881 RepID=A0AAE0GYP6_9CHLO|nr:hypothetical protein CYMTET_5788 [Cymbomonas tetramitiformis]